MSPARTFVSVGGVLGFIGVALGAFGAHGLKGWLQTLPDGVQRLAWWNTGTDYLVWHALLLVGIGLLSAHVRVGESNRGLTIAGWLVPAGVVLFSGSLFVMTLTGIKILGAVTPFGGVCFLGAWLLLAFNARKVL